MWKQISFLAALGLATGLIGTDRLQADAEPGVLALPVRSVAPDPAAAGRLAPDGPIWEGFAASPLAFSRTPGLYDGDPADSGTRPTAQARLVRTSTGALLVRLEWTDATKNERLATWSSPAQGEDRAPIQHTRGSDAFADRACVMWPERKGVHARYPSLMMGERSEPVQIACWTAGAGFSMLTAAGRGSVEPRKHKLEGAVRRNDTAWAVVFELPALPNGTPVAFGLWDGAEDHRDGLKYFSLWYQLAQFSGPGGQ